MEGAMSHDLPTPEEMDPRLCCCGDAPMACENRRQFVKTISLLQARVDELVGEISKRDAEKMSKQEDHQPTDDVRRYVGPAKARTAGSWYPWKKEKK